MISVATLCVYLKHCFGTCTGISWQVTELNEKRLTKILKQLKGKAITIVIDETGDRKKVKKTDYVARQYLGSVGKV